MARRGLLVVSVFLAAGAALAFAHGGGGITVGTQLYEPSLANLDLHAFTVGGYGYGVSDEGQRTGGFGLAILSLTPTGEPSGLAGGIGGVIGGQEFRVGPLTIALNVWIGVGGVAVGFFDPSGYMVAFGEVNLEIGFSLTRWMQVMAYAGMQGLGNVVPGVPFESLLLYTPVVGVRIAWGAM